MMHFYVSETDVWTLSAEVGRTARVGIPGQRRGKGRRGNGRQGKGLVAAEEGGSRPACRGRSVALSGSYTTIIQWLL